MTAQKRIEDIILQPQPPITKGLALLGLFLSWTAVRHLDHLLVTMGWPGKAAAAGGAAREGA